MNAVPGDTDGRALAALLAHIRRVCETERDGIRETAENEAKRILRDVRAQARTRVHAAIEEARYARERALLDVRAKRESELRRRRHRMWRELLDGLVPELGAAVTACWRRRQTRRRWITSSLSMAAEYLPADAWTLEHPSDCDTAELDALVKAAAPDGCRVEYAGDPALPAGIRIRAGEAVLDAGIEALLARRPRIEGLLLGEVRRSEGRGVSEQ